MASVLAWLMAHETGSAVFLIALIDYVIYISPGAASNNIVEVVLSLLQSLVGSVKPPPAP